MPPKETVSSKKKLISMARTKQDLLKKAKKGKH